MFYSDFIIRFTLHWFECYFNASTILFISRFTFPVNCFNCILKGLNDVILFNTDISFTNTSISK